MTRIILLLLVTLAGPFCAFTQASTLPPTTTLAKQKDSSNAAVTDATPDQIEKQNVTVGTTPVSDNKVTTPDAAMATVSTQEAHLASTEAQVVKTEAPVQTTNTTAQTEATEAAGPTEASPKETNHTENFSDITEQILENSTNEETFIDKDSANGTGQTVGIVLGALIGVIVIIAIIIFVVRRMGQYSPAKKRKPQKQQSILISPLKKKARQEEKKKKSGKF